MLRTVTCLLLSLALIGAAPALAADDPPKPRHLVDTGATPPRTDGDRYVLWTSPGVLHAFDTVRWKRWSMPLPPGCGSWARYSQWTRAAVDGAVAVHCGGSQHLISLPTRTAYPLTVPGAHVYELGKVWMTASVDGHYAGTAFVNRHTGEVRSIPRTARNEPAYLPDLDDPELGPLCGVAWPSSERLNSERFYGDGWYATRSGSVTEMRRCDGTRRVVLGRSTSGSLAWSLSVGGGLVTWGDARGWAAHDLHTGRRWRWRGVRAHMVLHTRNAVVFVAPLGEDVPPCYDISCPERWRVRIARVPR